MREREEIIWKRKSFLEVLNTRTSCIIRPTRITAQSVRRMKREKALFPVANRIAGFVFIAIAEPPYSCYSYFWCCTTTMQFFPFFIVTENKRRTENEYS